MKAIIQELKDTAEQRANEYIKNQYRPDKSKIIDEKIPFLLDDGTQIGYLKVKAAIYELVPAIDNYPDYPDDSAEIEVELHELEVEILNALGELRVNLSKAINKKF